MRPSIALFFALTLLIGACTPPTGDDDDSAGDDSDASLSALSVEDGAAAADLVLTPAFASDVTDYTATASVAGAVLTVSGTTSQEIFTVTINTIAADYVDDYNFNSAAAQNLTSPETITIGVVAPDGSSSMTYTVDVVDP